MDFNDLKPDEAAEVKRVQDCLTETSLLMQKHGLVGVVAVASEHLAGHSGRFRMGNVEPDEEADKEIKDLQGALDAIPEADLPAFVRMHLAVLDEVFSLYRKEHSSILRALKRTKDHETLMRAEFLCDTALKMHEFTAPAAHLFRNPPKPDAPADETKAPTGGH